MKRVKYTGKSPEYLDGFPKECKRSCKGAIHLLPNALKDITEDELKFIRKKYPKLKLAEQPKEKPPVARLKAPVQTPKASGSASVKKNSDQPPEKLKEKPSGRLKRKSK
jgi:hypothetical protein